MGWVRCVFGTLAASIIVFIIGQPFAMAQADSCLPCKIPCARPQDKSFSVRLTGGRTDPNRQFMSVVRDTTVVASETVQSVRLFFLDDGVCRDTSIQIDHIDAFVMGVTLGKVPPLYVPVKPVREYMKSTDPKADLNYFEVSGFLAYAGKDESTESPQQIGINYVYYGAGVLIAPFGSLLGDKISLGLGASGLFEGGRLRIPALGQLRYTFASTRVENSVRYIPSNCQFQCESSAVESVKLDSSYQKRPGPDEVDSSAVMVMERVAVRDSLAPFLYAEGGIIFDGGFEGSGSEPSVNPEDYSQYLLGAGAGIPIIPALNVSLGYRMMRLNLRTPCENCENIFQVNTNIVHSVLLRVALHLDW